MNQFEQRVFLSEIKQQSEFSLAAYERVLPGGDPQTIFYHVQAFLVSAANVSKLLFSGQVRGKKEFQQRCAQRAGELRAILGVDPTSPLNDRTFRDHFEHFDERIQEWADRPGPKIFVNNNVAVNGPIDQAVNISNASKDDSFRAFSTPPPIVWFWGKEHPLEPVAIALQNILQKIPQ